ncbi:TetR/AcrR family transcriptional regulator [Pseudoflavitalea sp. G-6-1-2]|uniref:TetR/AcrR family transcriptional regulator n=1 Tax=Pseudoflavitalea sp. G-6-1-2 TaxID=2728841 RepID=UPI001469D930|nr:TetR/AcrR family transcriptional regulator [Pseudoflavitalea sp. G-6-1-2]NML22134.1 TetR/AcrR family transcriptional regulator [Pseudoflavitalea sp. G-6-1-2]
MSNSQITKDPVRDDILIKARDLFGHFGFRKTTMEDIAKAIGKTKSALYYYYKTKEEIFEAVVLRDIDHQRTLSEEMIASVDSSVEKVRLLYTTILGSIREKADKFSIFRADLAENPLLLENIAKQRDSYIENILKEILRYGIGRKEIRPMSEDEMMVWAKTTNLAMRAVGSRMFLEDDYAFIEKHLAFLADTLLHGITQK